MDATQDIPRGRLTTDLGRHVFGASAMMLGILGFYYRDFASVWQPVPDGMPGRTATALVAALLFLGSGIALQRRSTVRIGAIILVILYFIFAALWARRIVGYPQIFATWGGTAEQLALFAAALGLVIQHSAVSEPKRTLWLRLCAALFGLCAVAFGFNHFFNMAITASMVPSWLPPSQWAWALITGIAHVAAGVAIITGILSLIAARSITLMFIGFGLIIWAPRMFVEADKPITWTGNAVNLSLIGAAWITADILASLRRSRGAGSGSPTPGVLSSFLDRRRTATIGDSAG